MDVRPHERLLMDLLPELPAGRAICNSAGRGQLAAALAARQPTAEVNCFFLDLYQHQEAQAAIGQLPPNLHLACAADPPPDEVDLALFACNRQGEAELSRDLLQALHERLVIGGRLAAASDNPRDQWLHEQLRDMFGKVTRRPHASGMVYLATKTAPLKKHKNFACELTFRDGERLVHLRTRPGVFGHRQLDGGARALVKAMAVEPGMNVLDLGCGSGAVGVAAALRAEGARVQAIDSSPRAIEATLWAARQNGAGALAAMLDCDGRSVARGAFDLVLANPPYYSNFQIAGLFLTIASRALAPGGRLLLVTKSPDWYSANLLRYFPPTGEVRLSTFGGYAVLDVPA